MSASLFFSGTIETAIGATVANRKPLVCFVTDEGDASSTWEREYLHDDSVSSLLQESAITVRLLKDSTEANYLNAFCATETFPTLLIIKNGGAGVDGLTTITNPISKEEFTSKIQAALNGQAPASLLDGVNSSPSFPVTPPASASTSAAPPTVPAAAHQEPSAPAPAPPDSSSATTGDELLANTQFAPDSATARRLASIQQQHRERIARLKAQREIAEREEEKKRELARRKDTRAMTDAAESQRNRGNRQYAEAEKKRKAEADKERRRVLDQIRADREEMRIREANRKAIAAEAEAGTVEAAVNPSSEGKGKGKQAAGGNGQCNLAFRLFDGSRVSHKFPADATVEKDVRPWLDQNRTDSNQPYKLVVQSAAISSVNIEGTSTLSELGLCPSAILILKPIPSSKVSTAFSARVPRVVNTQPGSGQQSNFFIAFLISIWLMIKTFLGMHNPNASIRVGDQEKPSREGADESSESGSGRPAARDAARKRFRTLHDGEEGDQRSAYYNGNQLDFEPRNKEGDKEQPRD